MTTDSHDNKLYKQQIVRIIVSPIYCWLLRLASKEPEYAVFLSCLYSLTAALPCKVGRDEYDRTNIENGNTALKQKNPAVEILLSIRRTRPCQGRLTAVVPLHDKKRHQGLCVCLCLQRLWACFLRQSDRWQIIALAEQHYRACQFGVKTVVLSACGKCVRQFVPSECGLNSLVRQQ